MEKVAYSATSRSGKVATRQFAQEMRFAIDVADPDAKARRARLG